MKAGWFRTLLLCGACATAFASVASAQSGSTGGSIGNSEKSLSGSRDEPRSVAPSRRTRPSREEAPRKSSSRKGAGVGAYDGTWTVVATGQCLGAGTFTSVVANGVISGPNLSGSVSSGGVMRTVGNFAGLTSVATGRVNGRSGGGTYVQSNGCRGSFRTVKN